MSSVSIRVSSITLGDITVDLNDRIDALQADVERAYIERLLLDAFHKVRRAYSIEDVS